MQQKYPRVPGIQSNGQPVMNLANHQLSLSPIMTCSHLLRSQHGFALHLVASTHSLSHQSTRCTWLCKRSLPSILQPLLGSTCLRPPHTSERVVDSSIVQHPSDGTGQCHSTYSAVIMHLPYFQNHSTLITDGEFHLFFPSSPSAFTHRG